MRCVIKNWWLTEGQLYNMLQLLSLFSGWITVDLHTFGVLLTFGGTGFTSTWFYMVFPDNRLYISQVGSVFFCDEDTTKSWNRWIWRRFSLISEPQERTRGWSDEKAQSLIRFPTADFLMWESSGNNRLQFGTYKKASHTILNNKILIRFFGLDWSLCKTVLSRET
jgi:hypothetical protein